MRSKKDIFTIKSEKQFYQNSLNLKDLDQLANLPAAQKVVDDLSDEDTKLIEDLKPVQQINQARKLISAKNQANNSDSEDDEWENQQIMKGMNNFKHLAPVNEQTAENFNKLSSQGLNKISYKSLSEIKEQILKT